MAFLQTFINVVMIVILAVPGYLLRKTKLLPDKAASIFAVLLLYISQPFLMMSSLFNKKFEPSMLKDFGFVLLFAVLLQFLVYFAARLLFSRTKDEAARRAAVASSYLGNVGFMGIPVMQMLFPGNDEMVLYTVVYNIAFNAMTWTLGVFAITGEKRHIDPVKIVLNPPTIAVIVALPFFFCNVHIPEQVMTPVSYLGNMTLPLSMIILGVRLADMHFFGAKRSAAPCGRQGMTAASAAPCAAAEKPVLAQNGGAEGYVPAAEGADVPIEPQTLVGSSAKDYLSADENVSAENVPERSGSVENVSAENSSAEDGVLAKEPAPLTDGAGRAPLRRGILDDPRVYAVAFVKLILSPLLGLGILLLCRLFLPIGRFSVIALFIIGAMPTASSALNFAEMFGGDRETAAAATLMNTILCILTIPVLMLLCDLI